METNKEKVADEIQIILDRNFTRGDNAKAKDELITLFYSSGEEVSDEDIKRWAKKTSIVSSVKQYEWGLIEGAKWMRSKLPRPVVTEERTEQYPIVCPSCFGSGYVSCSEFNPNVTGSAMNMICPACNGNKTVIVTRNY